MHIMEDVSCKFKELNDSIHTLSGGWLSASSNKNVIQVSAIWSAKDLINNKTHLMLKQYHVSSDGSIHHGFPATWSAKLQSVSPSGKYLAALEVDKKEDKGKTKFTSTIRGMSPIRRFRV